MTLWLDSLSSSENGRKKDKCFIGKQFQNSIYLTFFREQLKTNAQNDLFFLRVDMEDLISFDNRLGEAIRQQPNIYIDIFEEACFEVYKQTY